MASTLQGLRATQAIVTHPVQWQLLLALARRPQTTGQLLHQLAVGQYGHGLWGLTQLQRHHLVVFHMKQWRWSLTATGATLRPILTAIQTCSTIQKGGNTNDV